MKINLDKIENLIRVDKNTVMGTLETPIGYVKVSVSRRLNGWTPYLEIVAEDYVIHNGEATKDEMNAFDVLSNRAFESQMKGEEFRRNSIREEAAKILFH